MPGFGRYGSCIADWLPVVLGRCHSGSSADRAPSRASILVVQRRSIVGLAWATGRRDFEVAADLLREREVDLAVARHCGRALGVEAPEAVPAAFTEQPRAVRPAGDAPGLAASTADDEFERLAIGARDRGMVTEAKLEDAA